MRGKFKIILKDQFTRISFIFSTLFLIIVLGIIFVSYNNLPPLIPFFNSMPWGEDRLLASGFVIFLPAILVIVYLGNIFQAVISYSRYVLIARILMINTFLFILLGLLAYLQILFLTF